MIQHDVVIVGSGIAGMRCALEIKRRAPQADVALISKHYPTRASSVMERDGIAAALGARDGSDSAIAHARDTLAYGAGLANEAAVKVLTADAAAAVYELEHMGLPFNRTRDGHIDQRPALGHATPRLAYSMDRTGHAILHTLYGEIVRYGVKIYPEWFVLNLGLAQGRAEGVTALDIRTGEIAGFAAKAVVLATGSYGRVFGTTSDAQSSTGDGLALAYRAGLPLHNMELVQFHPLGLYGTGLALPEALLTIGGALLDGRQERFVNEGLPLPELSAAIAAHIASGRGSGPKDDHVWLDLRNVPAQTIREHYGYVIEYAKDYLGLDIFDELIPVAPTAKATLGGIPVNLDGAVLGEKGQPVVGLYAVGACAHNGVHGANALPGNELLAAVVFGRRTGKAVAASLGNAKGMKPSLNAATLEDAKGEIQALLSNKGDMRYATVRQGLLGAMSTHSGLMRQPELLNQLLGTIHGLRADFGRVQLDDHGRVFNYDLVEALELSRMLDWSETLAAGALARAESRGVHRRHDYGDSATAQTTSAVRQPNGTPQLSVQTLATAGASN